MKKDRFFNLIGMGGVADSEPLKAKYFSRHFEIALFPGVSSLQLVQSCPDRRFHSSAMERTGARHPARAAFFPDCHEIGQFFSYCTRRVITQQSGTHDIGRVGIYRFFRRDDDCDRAII